ncbi:MAG: dephospho-CoA kinase [Rubrivivax sp.]|nr:dephospho-CoA kinase [Rubrivivax sp.]
MQSLGLTGGIGSGKSTVAQLLVGRGALLIDTDAIARALTAPGGAALPAIAAAFGADMLAADGALDRQRMRELVFADAGAKLRLEAILHPLIGQQAQLEAAQAQGRLLVFDVPLLNATSPWRQRVDRVLVIDCDEATQVERVVQRSGWSADAVRQVINQQATRTARRAIADALIFNDGIDHAGLAAQVRALWTLWMTPAP